VQMAKEYSFDSKLSLTGNNLKQFIDDYVSGNLRPRIKSTNPPLDNTGPVRVITANTFNSEVLESEYNVLLEFWAPWCGHCKKLAPIYEKIGQEFKGNSNVVIANFDVQGNDPEPNLNVTGFPTVMFFPKGKKHQPITYSGERDFDSIVNFVKQNSVA